MYIHVHVNVFVHFFLTSPPSFLSYRRWDSSLRRFSSLGRKRGRQPFFLLSGVPQLQCGCAHSRSLIFSQPTHAVRRRRMWSIRSTIVGERRCRLEREGKNDRVVHWPAECRLSDSNFNHVADFCRSSCGQAEENVLQPRQVLMLELLLDIPPLAWQCLALRAAQLTCGAA